MVTEPAQITMTEGQVRLLRAILTRALQMIPDPDAPVHAAGDLVDRVTLCGRGGQAPRVTTHPELVTCRACRATCAWDAWVCRVSQEEYPP